MSVDAATDLAGQQVVGTRITSPWFAGTWEVTQGWGATDYGGEPEGHGYPHWHAGVDVGLNCGTLLVMPADQSGTARLVDNPGGYGTALVVELAGGVDVWLGHLRQRLVAQGAQLRPGDQLGVSNNTGNSTGCHLHFEVRPHGGRYGTDVDPSNLLLAGASAATLAAGVPTQLDAASGDQNPYSPIDPRSIGWELQHGIAKGVAGFVASGQVALGAGIMLGGLLAAGYGLRGQSGATLRRDVGRTLSGPPARRPPRRPAAPPVTGAERTRVRRSLQRRLPPEPVTPAPAYSYSRPRAAR